ncbi:translation initiation factor IF-3 [Candidatus Dojkabacteria bacterium]|jgi:translation initiation factor IF-3|nr:translation initiation factor IF-3 [Candidatus Dojkabacteria bacterium]
MKQRESENRINYLIKELTIRLVGDNVTNGVTDTKMAIKMAKEMELDLVEISGPTNGNPSICKIVDYQKYLYDKKKKDKEQKKKQKLNQSDVKEIRMTPNIDEHDFNFKLNHAKNFLSNNDKILVSVFFKGREITYKDQGQIVLLNFAKELENIGIPEYLPKLEGKKMLMMIKPKAKK